MVLVQRAALQARGAKPRHRSRLYQLLRHFSGQPSRSASNIEKSTAEVEKEMRGLVGQANANKRAYTSEEAMACSIEAMRNGGTCEACQ